MVRALRLGLIKVQIENIVGKEVQLVQSTDSYSDMFCFIDKSVGNVGILSLEDEGVVAIAEDGTDVKDKIRCVLFNQELMVVKDSTNPIERLALNAETVKNGLLLINYKPIPQEAKKYLLSNTVELNTVAS